MENVKDRKLFLHVGTHKTGTTSIQHAMRDGAEELNSEGLIYLRNVESIKSLINLIEYDPELVRSIRNELVDAAVNYVSNCKFVISWEGLSGTFYEGYRNSKVISAMMYDATKAEFDVEVIIYLRNQVDFIESVYTQSIHSGRNIELKDFLHKLDYKVNLDWRFLIENYSIFRNVVLRSYDEVAKDGLLIKSFGEIIGSEYLQSITPARKNVRYNQGAVKLATIVNKTLTSDERKALRVMLQRQLAGVRGGGYQRMLKMISLIYILKVTLRYAMILIFLYSIMTLQVG